MFSKAELGDQQAKLWSLNTYGTYLDQIVGLSIKLSDEIGIRYSTTQWDRSDRVTGKIPIESK